MKSKCQHLVSEKINPALNEIQHNDTVASKFCSRAESTEHQIRFLPSAPCSTRVLTPTLSPWHQVCSTAVAALQLWRMTHRLWVSFLLSIPEEARSFNSSPAFQTLWNRIGKVIFIMEGNIKIYIQLRKEELRRGFRSIKILIFFKEPEENRTSSKWSLT